MRIGASLRSAYAISDGRLGARWMIERAAAARDAGLHSLFLGDHHVVGIPYYQNTPMLGRLLAEWGDRPAGALFLLPLWNPVLVAEQVGTLASIAEGPFIIQVALGGGHQQFEAIGADIKRRPSTFEASLDMVKRLLAGETVSAHYPLHIEAARIAPVPPEPVSVWIGATADVAIERAARMGDGWLCNFDIPLDGAARQLRHYVEACRAIGREPGARAIRRDVHVGADDGDAQRVAGPILAAGYRGMAADIAIVGGPETTAARIAELAEAGFTDVIVRHLADDQGEVLASYERLAAVQQLVA
ncbi:MAG TPA: LLM class flavin-dependent oxidoreductase [Acidimicrobiales bacterium]|nr:LLM class flavin-dependent oxidoreductase [Acidimicrobiales bacterium]